MNNGRRPSVVRDKSFGFAVKIVELSRHLHTDQREYVLSKQVLRSGTAIGALVREAEYAESKPDFIHKLKIALKEANETEYWLELLFSTALVEQSIFETLQSETVELKKLLTSIINSTKAGMKNS